jgi:hypothetical protein
MRNIVCYRTNTNNDNHRSFIIPRLNSSSSPCNSPRNNRTNIYNIVTDTQCQKSNIIGPEEQKDNPGTKINVSNFYALMTGDNILTIAPGASIEFPNDGVTNNTVITRISATTFNLATVGIYEIFFQVSISEAGQLVIVLNNTEISYTVVSKDTGTNQIIGMSIISTILPESILSINNVAGNSTSLTIPPVASGNNSVYANLIIKQYI